MSKTTHATPEELANASIFVETNAHRRTFLRELAEHGYVIVHPDDVPDAEDRYGLLGFVQAREGWNACRAHIFGNDA